ncbi:hypothetical protein [Halorarum salinum]|uniref:Ig-like domain-containing protein n=1 Tax=Halorarum salinum TaxID=2743089 RepID=A0A7D5LAA1_9EURY|nr:hypothetical protein [Halobaculum salinum]QLG61893.1 hypothetical protein HUG12_09240 [Halobaculum salinum]
MVQEGSRRVFLSVLGATGTLFVSGCFGAAYDAGPGTLLLSNRHDRSHSLTVSVITDGETRWNEDFTLSAGGRQRREGYIAQPGTHTVAVEADTGDSSEIVIELRPSSASSAGVTGDTVVVSLDEEGALSLGGAIYD